VNDSLELRAYRKVVSVYSCVLDYIPSLILQQVCR